MIVTHIHERNWVMTLVADDVNHTVGRSPDLKPCIGWSVKHPLDAWNRRTGIAFAQAKIEIPHYPAGKVPRRVMQALPNFVERCSRFFKCSIEEAAGGIAGVHTQYLLNKIVAKAYEIKAARPNKK